MAIENGDTTALELAQAMAIYWCKACGQLLDDDYHPMEVGEICPECYVEVMEESSAEAAKARVNEIRARAYAEGETPQTPTDEERIEKYGY